MSLSEERGDVRLGDGRKVFFGNGSDSSMAKWTPSVERLGESEEKEEGVEGVRGVQGVQGVQGVRGVQGVQGVQGVRGVMCFRDGY